MTTIRKTETPQRLAEIGEYPNGPGNIMKFRGIRASLLRDSEGDYLELILPVQPMPESLLKGLKEANLKESQCFEIEQAIGNMTAMNFLFEQRDSER